MYRVHTNICAYIGDSIATSSDDIQVKQPTHPIQPESDFQITYVSCGLWRIDCQNPRQMILRSYAHLSKMSAINALWWQTFTNSIRLLTPKDFDHMYVHFRDFCPINVHTMSLGRICQSHTRGSFPSTRFTFRILTVLISSYSNIHSAHWAIQTIMLDLCFWTSALQLTDINNRLW